MSRLVSADSVLLIVDVQDKLLAAMRDSGALIRDIAFLASTAKLLNVPVIATEQYPKGLGPTSADLLPLLGHPPVSKLAFSCLGAEPFRELLAPMGRRQIVVTGIEGHVCVMQTVLDLLEAGNEVFLPVDAIQSRRDSDKQVALSRCERAGAILTTVEATAFEWLRGADHPVFKAVSQLVKDRPISG
ncbi:hydrolase [Zavarzinella formosa]|uniref:hydrolase n=1 Tax=Zavarzinella formosa TaxID=360055 RepID=UPI0002DFA8B8|nr:hydrolase [Zavarzinella formosa]